MEESHRRVLNDSLIFLKANLLVVELLDHLLEKGIITYDLRQKVNYEITDGSKVTELMCMLPKRGHQAFGIFLQACRATSQDHVADHLEAKLTAIKENQYSNTKTFVVEWLQTNIEPQSSPEAAGLSADELLYLANTAISSASERDNRDCRDLVVTELKKILSEVFSQPETAMNGDLLPLQLKQTTVKETTLETTGANCPSETTCLPKSMREWTVTHVCQWLERNGLDSDVIQQFRHERITGKALQRMNESDIKELSAVRLGDRITILEERNQYLANPVSSYGEKQTVDVSLSPVEATSQEKICTASSKAIDPGLGQKISCDKNSGAVPIQLNFDPPPEKLEIVEKVLATKEPLAEITTAEDVSENLLISKEEKEVESEELSSLDKEDFSASETKDIKSKRSIQVSESKDVISSKPKEKACMSKLNEAIDVSESEEDILTKFQKPSEVLRTFGNSPNRSFKYKKGAILSCIETRTGGNLLQPIHRFVMLEIDTKTGLMEFANEAVSFACACLNDRANGTIHFGIVPETSSGFTVHGKISGLVLKKNIEKYAHFLKKAFKKCFLEDQQDIIQECVRPAVFIEVRSETTEISEFVIEIDVIPEYTVCKDRAFLARPCKGEKDACEDYVVFQIVNGNVSRLTISQQNRYMESKQYFAADRKKQEDAARKKFEPRDELSKKFLHLLCDGEETFRGDQYRILVINKPDELMNSDTMKETFAFLADLEWKVIFDFDAEAKICKFLQEEETVMKIIMSDEFSRHNESNVNKKDRLKQTQEDIRNSVQPSWIFVNGYSPLNDESLSPRNWKMRKSDGFREAVRFIGHQFPEGRALVVFLLLSKDTDVVLEAAEEFIQWFPDQWLCVAEEESIGKPWIGELKRRNCIGKDSENDRVVFGMPWANVQDAVASITSSRQRNCCEIPTSAGSFAVLKNKTINELSDLEILGSFECDNSDIKNDANELRLREAAQKQTFFQGNGVSWWNFWFPGQVCERDVLCRLRKAVESSLDGVDDDVGRVVLNHQPGAGGTTTAKHLLWELRKSYRCAIVQTINDGQTANQILNLYQYEDNNPKPVLLLLDNQDEEKQDLLIADVSEKAKHLTRKGEDQAKCVCVFLICKRHSQYDPKQLVLKHALTPKEQNWFKDMHKKLLAEHKREPSIFTDPKLLISFNMLKENFNKDFIQRMVKSFLDNITDEKERRLLKYISLINAFDLECRALPTAAFDAIMIENPWAKKGHRWGKKAYSNRWETHLSSDFRILVNEASKPSIGYIHALRVINQLLSKEILSALRDLGNSRVPISDIALDFFTCTDIFYAASKARDDLLEISKDILKRRGNLPNGKQESFAPLIQTIVHDETTEKASAILEEGLKLTSDPFIAQQLARLFITVQNWQQAIKYAEMATVQKPDNSYLWDTFGRIYEGQLLEQYNKLHVRSWSPSAEEFVPIIKIALNGMEIFTKVQQTSQLEKNLSVNQAGFFGELQMIVYLLNCLTYLFQDKDKLRHFILEREYIPEECSSLACYEGINYITKLKQLNIQVQIAMNRLEDELFQLKEEAINEFRRNHVRHHSDSLVRLKESLNSYFGEDDDNVPESLEEGQKCEFRRRRIFRLAGFNLRSIFDLRSKGDDGHKRLQRIQEMAKQNVFSEHVSVTDYQTLISVTLALTSMDPEYLCNFNEYDSLVKWSKKLYELRDSSIVSHLEPYLFYVLFNWPRENTDVSPKVIESAIKNWKDAYYLKHPRQKDEGKPYRKGETTMFFLAKGRDMESIYTFFEEIGSRRNDARDRSTFWRHPVTVKKLQRFSGVLSYGGNEVQVHLPNGQGNKAHIPIQTSFPIQDRQMWNKEVYFVIGLSWIGPKAFDLTLDQRRITTELSSEAVSSKTVLHQSERNVVEVTEEEFRRKLKAIDEKLDKIQKLKNKKQVTVEEVELKNEEDELNKFKRELIQKRKSTMESRIPEY